VELVRGIRRDHDDVAVARLDLLAVHGEEDVSLDHEDGLLVRMGVQGRAGALGVVGEEGGDGRAGGVAFEALRVLGTGQVGDVHFRPPVFW
jgi:hypothetical protein